mgnify:CR=1 FL=1
MDRPDDRSIIALLQDGNIGEAVSQCEADRRAWKLLRTLIYETDEEVLWPALEAIGEVMRRRWSTGRKESVREYIRALLWSLSDESGGIGWNAPQTIAEIIVHIPELAVPYASMAISRALEEPPLVPSGLWAIGRLGPLAGATVDFCREAILDSFKHSDPRVLALVAWAAGQSAFAPALLFLYQIEKRPEPVRLWVGGHFEQKTLGEWAAQAIGKIQGND